MRWFPVLLALGACGDPKTQPDAFVVHDDLVYDEALIDANDPNMPRTLADTGLCVDAACAQIATGVHPYTPRFELWSDSATKRRWIYVPPSTQINTTNMEHWDFPVGTKLWKEFTRGTTRVETRLIMRVASTGQPSDWFYAAYVWNAAQNATTWAEFGQADANGTQHDVPSTTLCRVCHENNKPSRVLGFSAIQLDFDGAAGEIDLADAIANSWLSAPPTVTGSGYFPFPTQDSQYTHAALGYMHANCGHCHNPSSNVYVSNTQLDLRLTTSTLGSLASTPPYVSAVNVMSKSVTDIVEPGMPGSSNLILRFNSTNIAQRMPQAGSEDIDTTAATLLDNWVTNIPP